MFFRGPRKKLRSLLPVESSVAIVVNILIAPYETSLALLSSASQVDDRGPHSSLRAIVPSTILEGLARLSGEIACWRVELFFGKGRHDMQAFTPPFVQKYGNRLLGPQYSRFSFSGFEKIIYKS